MAEIGAKQHRKLNFLLKSLFSVKSFEPDSFEAARRLGLKYLHHELRLRDGKNLLLTDEGLATLREIDCILRAARLVEYAETWDFTNALWEILKDLLSEGKMPDDSRELVSLVRGKVEQMRHHYWYAVPVNGIELEGVNRVRLGKLTLTKPMEEELERLGAKLGKDFKIDQALGNGPCLIGSVYGTKSYAKRNFRFRAEMTIGVVAAIAAASYEKGSVPFRISLEMTASGAQGVARYTYRNDDEPGICRVRDWSEHQSLRINSDMADYIQSTPYIQHAFGLANRNDLSPLEETIVRSFFWFSDAQRDTVPVMQLVKFWSCAEGFFSEKGVEITKSVSEGVACILVFGVNFKPPDEYKDTVSKLVELYTLRSKAVHGAHHTHVTHSDIVRLSQYTGWMLLGIAGLIAENGYTMPEEVRSQTERLARQMKGCGSKLACSK